MNSWTDPFAFTKTSNNNPQKDNFHNPILDIDKMVTFGIVSSTFLMKLSLSKGGGGWRYIFTF